MTRILVGSLAAALVVAAPAGAEKNAWYASIEAGANFADVSASAAALPVCGLLGLTPCGPDTSLDTGVAIIGAIGTSVFENVRIELEAGYRSASFGGVSDLTNTTVMLNALLDVPLSESLILSVGGGLGADVIATDAESIVYSGQTGVTVFAHQLIVQLGYDLTDTVALTASFRETGASIEDPLYGDVPVTGAAGPVGVARIGDVDTSTVSVGLRFRL